MSSIGEVMSRFGDLYGAGNYADALMLVNNALPEHPAEKAMLTCFSAAMCARLGDTSSALSAFQSALDSGFWYHEGALRSDPDFASLQAVDEFVKIVEINAQRRQAALENAKPLLRILEPAASPNPAPLLIALHGNLSRVDEFASYWIPAVEQGWRVALPQSSRLSWLSGAYDWQDVDVALTELDQHYQALLGAYEIDATRTVIAGFSAGAFIAERAAVTKRLPVSGLLWVEGVADKDIEQLLPEHQPHHFRTFFAYGQSQDFSPTADALSKSLSAVGIPCQLEPMPSPYHELPASFPQTLDRALRFLCL